MDHEGYGKSSRTDGNSDIASGVEDLKAAVEVVARETGQMRYHFLGKSSGAIRAGAFAVAMPDRVDRLLLGAFTYTGKGSPTLAKRAEGLDYFRTPQSPPARPRNDREHLHPRRPGTTDPAVAPALADMELVHGDTVPTGTYLDMTSNLPLVDPTKVTCPVCMLRGEYDGIATERGPVGLLSPTAQWRSAILHHRRRCARIDHLPQPRGILAYRVGIPDDAAATRDLTRE